MEYKDIDTQFKQLCSKSRQLIFYCNSNNPVLIDDFNYESLLRKLSFNQRKKLYNLRHGSKAYQTLTNQLLLNFILGLICAKDTPVTYNRYGKPMVEGVSFNMSNSNEFVAIVIDLDNNDIGIDLSDLRDDLGPDFLNVYKEVLNESEIDCFEGIIKDRDQRVLFNKYWALKESYGKLLGVGINYELNEFSFRNVKQPLDSAVNDNCSDGFFINKKIAWNRDVEVYNAERKLPLQINLGVLIEPDVFCSVITGNIQPSAPAVIEINMDKLVELMLT